MATLPLDRTRPEGADYTLHRLLLGTHTSGQAQDQLLIAQVAIPKAIDGTLQEYDDERGGAPQAASSPRAFPEGGWLTWSPPRPSSLTSPRRARALAQRWARTRARPPGSR